MTDRDDLARRFQAERPRLVAIATRLTGSASDAEDAAQETWLRLQRVDTSLIDNLPAWLTTVISRVSLDVLKAPRRGREQSWQVEPWQVEHAAEHADPADDLDVHDRVGVALLIVLEQLSPAERIAFVLHDVFGHSFAEVGVVLERTPEAARQLASRGRRRAQGASLASRASASRNRQVVNAWLRAAQDGDFAALLALLGDRVVLHADYGASSQVLDGPQAIAEQAVLSARLAAHSTLVLIGGQPGVAAVLDGSLVSVMAFTIEDDSIVRLDVLADPERLASLIERGSRPGWGWGD